MKHLSAIIKSAILALFVVSAASAAAEYQRVPEPGSIVETSDAELLRMQRNLINFVKKNSLSADNLLEPAMKPAPFKQIRQRPLNALRTPDTPTGDIRVMCSRYQGQATYEQSYYGKLNPINGKTTPIYKGSVYGNDDEFGIMSGIIRNDILYIPQLYYGAEGMATQTGKIRWKRVDLVNGKVLTPIYYNLDTEGMRMFLYSATYVESEDKIYGLSLNVQSGGGGELVVIDCSQPEWKAQSLGNLGASDAEYMCNIVYNPVDQKFYGFKSNLTFNEIDLSGKEPKCIIVNEYDDWDEYYCQLPAKYSSGICYSPYDHAFIYYVNNPDTGDYILGSIDAETYEAFMLCEPNPAAYFPMLYCADPYAEEDAPNRMGAPVVNFPNATLTGTLTVTAPTTYFNSLELEGNVIVHILVDGKEIFSTSCAPGTKISKEFTLEQGLRNIETYASLGELNGPKNHTKYYIGYDEPLAPTNLQLANGKLTWKTPSSKGVNSDYHGYLDLSDVTYDVYLNGKKLNSAPIKGNEYAVSFDNENATRQDLTVTATSHNQTSAHSSALNRSLGVGFALPASFTPTEEEAELFESVDANNDGYAFKYLKADKLFSLFTTDYEQTPNDWLFLPPIYCDSAENTYNFVFDYINSIIKVGYLDCIDVCIGKDPLPSAMGTPFYSHKGREQITTATVETTFSVPEPGTYYIGIHSSWIPPFQNPNPYRGIEVNNFKVSKNSGTIYAPGELTDIKATAAPQGELQINLEATLPAISFIGTPLPADKDITLTIETEGYKNSVVGKPGEKISLSIGTDIDGINTVTMTPSSEDGIGKTSTVSLYVGIDTPLPPANVKGVISDDNMSIVLTWDPVGNVGVHGGYVDPAEINYEIWTQEGINNSKIGNAYDALTYTYTGKNKVQATINIGPVATNYVGSSTKGTFFSDMLGKPHAIPVVEEFGYTAFNYQKWTFNTFPGFDNTSWGHCNETISLGYNVNLNANGGILGQNSGAGTNMGELRSPKVSTLGVKKADVSVTYLNCKNAAKMEFWGRTAANQEYRKLAELTPSRPATAAWDEFVCTLPEDFGNQGWIQVNLRGEFQGDEIVLIDNYKVLQNIENDFTLTSLSAPYSAFVGEEPKFDIVVTNSGNELNSGTLVVELLGDNEVLQSHTENIGRIRPNEVYETQVSFPMLEDYINYDYMEVRATAQSEDDSNDTNDTEIVEFVLHDSSMPVVRDLKASVDNKGVNLTWSEPDAYYKGLESFELAESFTNNETIDRWTNIDGDGKAPFVIDGKRWKNDDAPCAWTVYDARSMKTLDNDRLSPRTGDRMLIARSIQYADYEEPSRSFDWLISPEVKGGSRVSFWLNTISSTYTETVQLWYSTTDNQIDLEKITTDKDGNPLTCGSFKKLQNFTKSGEETWEFCSAQLPAEAKYFAFVYASYGQFAAMIDDITFSPVDPGKVSIEAYDVLVSTDGNEPEFIGTVDSPGFTHTTNGDVSKLTYYVKTVHNAGNEFIYSPLSNPAKADASGVNEIENGKYVIGGKGHILVGGATGDTFILYDMEGRTLVNTTITSDRQSVACQAGIYTAKLGNSTVKLIVR